VPCLEEDIMGKWVTRIVIAVILIGIILYFGTALLMGIQGGHV
jgi:hypothetical protein